MVSDWTHPSVVMKVTKARTKLETCFRTLEGKSIISQSEEDLGSMSNVKDEKAGQEKKNRRSPAVSLQRKTRRLAVNEFKNCVRLTSHL